LPSLDVCRGTVLLLALALAGCEYLTPGKVPEPPPLNPTLYPAKYKSDIADFMRTYLNNPTKVKDAMIGQPVLKPVAGQPHYVTCVRYNPRDSANRYEGEHTNFVVFLGGKIAQFLPADPEVCSGLSYQRYPEIESMVP
jgi:hypothetical protein